MRTAIITRKDKTTLNIVTSEDLYLEQMGAADQIHLTRGVNHIPVGAGVFKVLSKAPVRVTADTQDVEIVTTDGKDGGSIDPLIATSGLDKAAVTEFLLDERSQSAPQ